jgi:hypothetical protein
VTTPRKLEPFLLQHLNELSSNHSLLQILEALQHPGRPIHRRARQIREEEL